MERSSPNSKGRPIPPLDKRQSRPSLKSPSRFRIFALIGLLTVLAVSLVILFVIGVKGLREKKYDGQFTPTVMPVPVEQMQVIAGTWTGRDEVDESEWQITFESNRAVWLKNSKGYYHQGTAFIHWNLGLIDGSMRVPPGWSSIDVDITQSSEPSFSGKVSLGAYSLRHDGLHFCFTEPGIMTRPITDVPREGIRCVVLKKSATAEPSKSTTQPGIAYSPFRVNGTVEGSSPDRLQPADKAEVIIDGVREFYPLRKGPGAKTYFSYPKRAIIEFQAYGGKYPDARKIEITLDSSRTGLHLADGRKYIENMFMKDKIPVGYQNEGETSAIFLFIAEGGRIYPPKTICVINITSPYIDSPESIFEGWLQDCKVRSAGDEHTISFRFSVKGILKQ
jgi:hypothetical protein